MTAARLKALGVDSIVVDRNSEIGENWTRRYDCLKFHVPTSNCELPFSGELDPRTLSTTTLVLIQHYQSVSEGAS